MSERSNPEPAELAADLAGMLRSGVSIQALRDCESILNLSLTKAKAASEAPDDLAVAADTLIREAARRVDDGDAYGAAGSLLGVAPGTRGELLKRRREKAAKALFVSPETLRKEREDGLIEAVAAELYALDSAYRFRHRHREEAEREPQDNRLGIDWLEQHRSYRRIWSPVVGMRKDLAVLREYLAAEDEDRDAISDRLANITWQWARFSLAIERFVKEQGGLWLLADMDSEIAAADAIYKLEFYVPFGETDSSWMRTMLLKTPHEELDGFGDKLFEAGERRRELMGLWIAWAGCPEAGDSGCDCNYHRWQRTADEFIRLIDDDWYAVADFYRNSLGEAETQLPHQ